MRDSFLNFIFTTEIVRETRMRFYLEMVGYFLQSAANPAYIVISVQISLPEVWRGHYATGNSKGITL